MKKIFLPIIAMLLLITACDYNEINFDGLDEATVPTDVKKFEYTLTDADYTAIANNAANKALAEADGVASELSNLKSSRRFSETLPASKYIPAFLAAQWFTADNGSAVKVTYNKGVNLPAYLNTLASAETYTVSATDYASVWGTVDADYFTPAKPLSSNASKILSAAYPDAVSGDVKIVSYNYSATEPGGEVPLATFLDESFDGVTANSKVDINGWTSIAQSGDIYWVGKSYNGNYYAQCTAYGSTSEIVSWLISPALSLTDVTDPKLTFDVTLGYYNADCLQVMVSEDYNGVDPSSATWVDVTHNFGFYGAGGYTSSYVAGICDLNAYKENPVHIAFKYTGDGSASKTTTYQVDNVQVNGTVRVDEAGIFSDDFSAGIDSWTNVAVQGTKTWAVSSYSGQYRVSYSAYNTTEEQEGWLVSPAIAVPATGAPQLWLDVAVGYYNAACLSVLVSSDFAGDVTTATWTDVTSALSFPESTSGYSPVTFAGAASLRKFAGSNVHVAFKYVGNGADSRTTTYQIYNMDVVNLTATAPAGAPGLKAATSEVNEMFALYTFNGSSWSAYNNASVVNPADYEAMGVNYFSSSAKPENYLPAYLSQYYPYAQEGKTVAVVYNYGNGSSLSADEYTFTEGSWMKNNAVEVVTDQFVRTGGKWIWDPSVVINLAPIRNDAFIMSYYQAATDWVWENIDQAQLGITTKGQGYVTSYGNNDYYTGCSAYYNNVDMRAAKAREQYPAGYEGLSDDEVVALMKERLAVVMGEVLKKMHPDAKAIDGVDVTYTVNVGIYTGTAISGVNHSLVYKVVGTGDFEHVSGPDPIE